MILLLMLTVVHHWWNTLLLISPGEVLFICWVSACVRCWKDNCSFLCVSASMHVDIAVWIGYVQHDEYRGCRIIKLTQY